MHISSTNLTPDMPVSYEIRASTHHWDGVLLDDSWAAAEMNFNSIYEIENALAHFKKSFLALQKISEPPQDIRSAFRLSFKEGTRSIILLAEDKKYYDVVKLATSEGWKWEEDYNENLVTGERRTMGGSKPFNLSLSTWEWGGKALGSSVAFSHFQREGESKASLLLRVLETAEKAKQDFPDSIPYTNIYGEIKVDEFKTRIIFGS
jgi:hypothetical protein